MEHLVIVLFNSQRKDYLLVFQKLPLVAEETMRQICPDKPHPILTLNTIMKRNTCLTYLEARGHDTR